MGYSQKNIGKLQVPSFKLQASNNGFTLVELVVVIAVAVVLASTGFLNIVSYRNNQGVSSEGQEILTVLRAAQNNSLSQEEGKRWGVYFENTTSSGAFYVLFSGSTYSATTTYVKNVLPSNIQFDLPVIGTSSSIVFAPVTGLADSELTVKISLINNPDISRTVTINTNGVIDVALIPSKTIIVSAGFGGSILPSGSVIVNERSSKLFTITPNSSYAIFSVLVDNIEQGAIDSYNFTNIQADHTISASFVALAPTVSAINPSSGVNSGSVSITSVTGANFVSGATVKLTKSGQSDISCTGFSFTNSTTLSSGSCPITGATAGTWNVVVTNPGAQTGTLTNGFTVTVLAPTVAAINPVTGINNASVSITSVTGANFVSGATVKLTKSGQSDISCTGFSFTNSTTLSSGSCPITGASVGTWNVVVTNPDTQTGTLTNGFTVTVLAPTVSAINPSSGNNSGSVSITSVTGTDFVSGATVKLTKSGQSDISCTGFSYTSSSTLSSGSCPITGASVGLWSVVVTNPDTQTGTLSNGFSILGYPLNLALSHSDRNKSFSVSWTAGLGNGGANGCKLQFYTGSVWSDITSGANVNCDTDSSSASYILNADGWKSSWNGTQVRLLRKSDSTVMGTFSTTLACTTTSGSGSSTPTIDEDCNGYWDNTTSYGCGTYGCTQPGKYVEFYHYDSTNATCSGPLEWAWGGGTCCGCTGGGPMGCTYAAYVPAHDTNVTLINASCCAYGYFSTCYTYY